MEHGGDLLINTSSQRSTGDVAAWGREERRSLKDSNAPSWRTPAVTRRSRRSPDYRSSSHWQRRRPSQHDTSTVTRLNSQRRHSESHHDSMAAVTHYCSTITPLLPATTTITTPRHCQKRKGEGERAKKREGEIKRREGEEATIAREGEGKRPGGGQERENKRARERERQR